MICKELAGATNGSPFRPSSPSSQLSSCGWWSATTLPPAAFQGVRKPSISVRHYLVRIFRYACCSPSCYVVAYIYLNSFAGNRQAVALDSFNVHRLLITSVLTAVKFMDDMYVSKCHPPQETEQLALGINNCIAQL
ncbi:hypothetical protein ZIOFF_029886 [Zingiber officinale]|uniref:Uncharacterized protein n=1 Tax=Zingiber officinale TaxID=94328 RepID=A0A8J5GUI0_ZINOF|nr:hypothetical protein ZIOFF_029886 [Zingiber officinale]